MTKEISLEEFQLNTSCYEKFNACVQSGDYAGAYVTFMSRPTLVNDMTVAEAISHYDSIRRMVGLNEGEKFKQVILSEIVESMQAARDLSGFLPRRSTFSN